MKDPSGTKQELIKEISALKQRIQEFEQLESEGKLVEKALWKSEEKFRTIFDRAGDGILITDAITKKFLHGNTAIFSMLGYTKEEIESLTIYDIHPPQEISLVRDAFEKLAKGETVLARDLPVLRKDGSIFYAEIGSSSAVIGGAHCLLGIFRDITERKRAEEALRKSEEKYRLHFENVTDIIFSIDPDLRLLSISPSVERMLGYKPQDLEGKTVLELNITAPASLARVGSDIKRVMAGERIETTLYEFRAKDGTKRFGEVSASPLFYGGRVVAAICVSRDITERKQVEAKLRKSEERYRHIVETSLEGIWIINEELLTTFVNKRLTDMLGYEPADILGKRVDSFMLEEDLEDHAARVDALRLGVGEVFERRLRCKDGTTLWNIVSSTALCDGEGRFIGAFSMFTDITDRKKAEEQLHHTLDSLRKAVNTTIQAIVSAVETRDPYTAGHQIRSANLAGAIATEMGLSPEKIEGIRMAGAIHDIGKISIPAEILSKPKKLSEIEFPLIQEHAKQGYEILKNVESPWPLAEIVRQHHERMDGSGYPRNLKGEEICLEARILAVSDVVESMESHRPYRPGLGIHAALEEIEQNRGILYDNIVADACLRLFREKDYKIEGSLF